MNWFENLAEKENCDKVIYLGDTFDKSTLNAEEITALQDIKFSNIEHVFLTGNHEASIANLDFSSAKLFNSINADVVDSNKVISINDNVDLYLIPYITSNQSYSIKPFLRNDNKRKVVLTHNDIAGIRYGKFKSQAGFDVDDVEKNCALMIDGHLHNSCKVGKNIILAGNLTGQNFNEDALKYDHQAYIMEIDSTGSINIESFINPFAFNFYKLYINKREDLKKLECLRSNAILSIQCSDYLIKDIEKIIKNLNVVEYKIIALYDDNSETSDDTIFSAGDHFQQFIDYVQLKLPKSKILDEELSFLGE